MTRIWRFPLLPSEPQWPVTLEYRGVRLSPFRTRDIDACTHVRERNAGWLEPWDATAPDPDVPRPSMRSRVRSTWKQARDGFALPWLIRAGGVEGVPIIGSCTVSNIGYGSAQSAAIGYWIDRAYAGRGITPTAVAMATDYSMKVLGLHRIEICIRPENAASLRVVEKLGFREEGMRLKFIHIAGDWRDHRVFALTAPEIPQGLVARLG
ncbi:MAG: GNAT family N-acetyltransferase [Propionibacteriaceae bacterium]|jgi:ribosomal-protein-alanine N-acetyltransferase|nr:GNAT family N-acetyltransferase [Propionibacteriaceae bacterium]